MTKLVPLHSVAREDLMLDDHEARSRSRHTAYVPAYTKRLRVLDGEELLRTVFPARSLMLAPWLPEKGLAMVHAPRGVGKTWIALSIAHAVACGGEFLCWQAPTARRVLYIDGEMPTAYATPPSWRLRWGHAARKLPPRRWL